MFHSFFPRPRLFFLSFAIWALLCVVFWFTVASDYGRQFSIGGAFGFDYPAPLSAEPGTPAATDAGGGGVSGAANDTADAAQANGAKPEAPSAEQLAHATQVKSANSFWFYQFMTICYLVFVAFWMLFAPHKWQMWSILGSALIVFTTWFQVQLDVMINNWFGRFYDTIQLALSKPGAVTIEGYYGQLVTFLEIAMVAVILGTLTRFFISHYIFRWRTAMNDYYTSKWPQLRHIEGASQRIQEDTMRFASIMESLGVALIDAVMTLIAFLPILWALSVHIKVLPIIGEVSQALVFVAILWSVFGTALIALAGIKLPGLEFRNQRVEAAFRKELVYGEDNETRAQPPSLVELFSNVRRNYFRLYFHYMYFNVVRISYLQIGVILPYFVLAPTIVAAGFTLGVMQQIIRAFQRVENSFQLLVNSWTTIVELLSIYKRLQAFEAAINNLPLPEIDQEFLQSKGA
ncbi:MAG: peptide antibiotic transporter SbmA [Burkholderiaceae bacterium]